MKLDNKTTCAEYGRRSGRKMRHLARYLIEGELVTVREMAERMGVSKDIAKRRFRHAKAYHDTVTWEGMSR